MKRPFNLLAAIFLLTTLANAQPYPNVVLIISDDAGFADYGFMDEITGNTTEIPTPNLDVLRSNGVLFSNAYTGSVCSPSRAAITTGLYQNRLGYEYNINNLTSATARDGHFPETVTVFEWMNHLGYTTGAIGKWHIGAMADNGATPGNRPQRQGVDEFMGLWGGSRTYTGGVATLAEHILRRTVVAPNGSMTDTVLENQTPWNSLNVTQSIGLAAEEFIAGHHEDVDELQAAPVPFFLYVAFTAPHTPLHESPDYGDLRISGLSGNRRKYASMMLTMDKAIGGITDRLEDPNDDGDDSDSVMGNTVIIFINDNGGSQKSSAVNLPLRGFKGHAWEGGARVPMLITGPDIPANGVYPEPVHSIDIVPTICRIAGGVNATEVDGLRLDALDGVDLTPFINGSQSGVPHETIIVKKDDRVLLRKGDWKLIGSGSALTFGLYNLSTDIGETNNRALAEPAILADLLHELNLWEARFNKPRHASLNSNPESINQNDGFIAAPPNPADDGFSPNLTLVGGAILNGNFNASAVTDGKGSFADTGEWVNLGTGNQNQTATQSTIDYDGSRTAIIAETDLRVFGLDTLHTLSTGEIFHASYVWYDAADWEDGSDRIRVTLFTTADDTINGDRTVIESVTSQLSLTDSAYQPEDHFFNPLPSEFSGKRLFLEINAAQAGISFARMDNFVLERGQVVQNNESIFTWSAANRWIDADTGLEDTLLRLDGFPGAQLEFPSRDFNYMATNDLDRITGLEFMLNKLSFTGADYSNIVLNGKALAMTRNLQGEDPTIDASFSNGHVRIENDVLLFNDLYISGNGTGSVEMAGNLSEESISCSLIKDSIGKLIFTRSPSYTGSTVITSGTLAIDGDISVNACVLSANLEISGTGQGSDKLVAANHLDLNGATLQFIDQGGAFTRDAHIIAQYDTLSGIFISTVGIPDGFHINYAYHDGQSDRHIAIVRGAPFASWATNTSGLSGDEATFGADPNGDGVSNGLAFFLGLHNAVIQANDALPALSLSTESVVFTFNRLKAAAEFPVSLSFSQNLTGWILLENGLNGVTVETVQNPVNAALDKITVRLPNNPIEEPAFLRVEVREN